MIADALYVNLLAVYQQAFVGVEFDPADAECRLVCVNNFTVLGDLGYGEVECR